MIGFVKGTLCDIAEDSIVVEAGGIGYNILVSAKVFDFLPAINDEIKIYTYLSVREDAMKLYGFIAKNELEFFKLLICVNGVGPKVALGILSGIDIDDLRFAIMAGDAKTISKCPGIGAKTAQRIILDLKDKVDIVESLPHTTQAHNEAISADLADGRAEAIEALVALGFSQTDALRAVRSIEEAEGMNVEDIIKAALKYM